MERPVRGLSLVEILVALVLGLFLIGGIIQVLSSNGATYRLAEAKARTQENGRYASQMLAKDTRPSRSMGCRSIAQDVSENGRLNVLACALLENVAGCSGQPRIGTKTPLGYSDSTHASGGWLAGLPGDATSGARGAVSARWLRGDVLVSWGATGEGFYVKTGQANPTAPIRLIDATNTADLDQTGLRGGRLAMITDCKDTDIFVNSDPADPDDDADGLRMLGHSMRIGDSKVNTSDGLSKTYNATEAYDTGKVRARIFPFDFQVYFICCMDNKTGALQSAGVGTPANCVSNPTRYRPALCRWSATAGTESLAVDVADMRVTYDGRLDPTSSDASGGRVRFGDVYTSSAPDADGNIGRTYALPDAAWVQAKNLWDQVYSARIELLLTDGAEVLPTAQLPSRATVGSATGLGAGMAADRRFYDTLETTIALRSRAPWIPSP